METLTGEEVSNLVNPKTIESYSKLKPGTRGYHYMKKLFGIQQMVPGITCLQLGINADVGEFAVEYVERRRLCGQITLEPDQPFSINREPAVDRNIKGCLESDDMNFPKVCILPEAEGGCHYSLGSRANDDSRTQCPLLTMKLKRLQELTKVDRNGLVQSTAETDSVQRETGNGNLDFDPFTYDRLNVIASDPTTVLIRVIMKQAGVMCFSPRVANTHKDRELFSKLAFDEDADRKGIKRTINAKDITAEQAALIIKMKKMLLSGGASTIRDLSRDEIGEQIMLHMLGLAQMGVAETSIVLDDLRKMYEVYGMEIPGTALTYFAERANCIDYTDADSREDGKYSVDFKGMARIHKPGFGANSSPYCGNCKLLKARGRRGDTPICPIVRPEVEKPV